MSIWPALFIVNYRSESLPKGIPVAHRGSILIVRRKSFVSRNRFSATAKVLGFLVLAILIRANSAAAAPVTGAIFTTTVLGEFVNANVYDAQEDVYLNGGPKPNAPCTAAGLPDGDYYFQVTDPSGSVLLSNDLNGVENRRVMVSKGVIVSTTGTHYTGVGGCGDITIQLSPYNQTPNEGGEYKVWMTPVGAYSGSAGSFGFLPKYSKTDNFKVNIPEPVGCNDPSCILQ